MPRTTIHAVHHLARTILAAPLDAPSLVASLAEALGPYPGFLGRLTTRILTRFPEGSRPSQRRLEDFLIQDRPLIRFLVRFGIAADSPSGSSPRFLPASGRASSWNVPAFSTEGELAHWLGIEPCELLWFADICGLERRTQHGSLRHYHRFWKTKKSGGARLIESPKPRLKAIQRRILYRILDHIPAHPAAHGFRRGRSTFSFAAPHTRKEMVLRMDLRDFFPTVSQSRVAAIFRTAGYPDRVATLLAGLCCTVTPAEILAGRPGRPSDWPLRKALEIPHLPQGAPTSPTLANLCAFRLDARLSGFSAGAGAAYTRYADDLTFSGGRDFARGVRRFEVMVGAIALEEGFGMHHRKTRVMPKSVSQRTAGLVVNNKPAAPRENFDNLRALLFNCIRYGPATQNHAGHADFRAHLAGRVAQMVSAHPGRRARLENLWRRICWDDVT